MSKFELPEAQFERTFRAKIACQPHLEEENVCFNHIFVIFFKFLVS